MTTQDVAVEHQETLRAIRVAHWLSGMECDHETKTDRSSCACGWVSRWQPNVGGAVEAWWKHYDDENQRVLIFTPRPETEFTFSISLADLVIKVQIPDEPQAWERATPFGKGHGKPIDTKANKIAKSTIRQYIGLAYPRLEMNPRDRFGVVLLFATKLWTTDADNYTKLVLDACKAYVWKDDRQVDELFVRVARGNVVPRTQLFFYLLREAPQL